MAEECAFYYYDRDYCCRLLKQSNREYVLNSDWVHRYCWGYNYDDCPYYKNKESYSSSGGCYLTSACVKAKGLPDNCEELQTLRMFRDTYLKSTESGRHDIKHYYLTAPQIVGKINESESANSIWEQLYDEMILPCVRYIKEKNYQEAFKVYKRETLKLEEQYLAQND